MEKFSLKSFIPKKKKSVLLLCSFCISGKTLYFYFRLDFCCSIWPHRWTPSRDMSLTLLDKSAPFRPHSWRCHLRRLKAPLWGMLAGIKWETHWKFVHHIVFSSGRGIWGIKMENRRWRHWNESVWAAAEWIQRKGEKKLFWSHDAFFINHQPYCVTKGFCTGILFVVKTARKFRLTDLKNFSRSALCLFTFQVHLHGNQLFLFDAEFDWTIIIRGGQKVETSFISCCSNVSRPAERCICYLPHLLSRLKEEEQDMQSSLDLRAVAGGSPPSQ